MTISRRSFLRTAGAALATPAVLRAQVETHVTQTEKISMEIKRIGSQPSSKGPADWFTGTVRIDPLFQPNAPARTSGASVTFEPGARTAWHTHPLGQTLIVTAGCGWVQQEGGPIDEIHPGDVISIPPGEKHWHGATPTTAMTHIAIQEALDGKAVDWLEKSATNNTASELSPRGKLLPHIIAELRPGNPNSRKVDLPSQLLRMQSKCQTWEKRSFFISHQRGQTTGLS